METAFEGTWILTKQAQTHYKDVQLGRSMMTYLTKQRNYKKNQNKFLDLKSTVTKMKKVSNRAQQQIYLNGQKKEKNQ